MNINYNYATDDLCLYFKLYIFQSFLMKILTNAVTLLNLDVFPFFGI